MPLTNKKKNSFNSCMRMRVIDIDGHALELIKNSSKAYNDAIRHTASKIVKLPYSNDFRSDFNEVSRDIEAYLKEAGVSERNWGKGYPCIQPISEYVKRVKKSVTKSTGRKVRLPRVRNLATYLHKDHKKFAVIKENSDLFILLPSPKGERFSAKDHQLMGGQIGTKQTYVKVPLLYNKNVERYINHFNGMTMQSCILYKDRKSLKIYASISVVRDIDYVVKTTNVLGVDIGIASDYTANTTTNDGIPLEETFHGKIGKDESKRRTAAKSLVSMAQEHNALVAMEKWNMRDHIDQTHMKLSELLTILQRECDRANVPWVEVPRKFTSRTCHNCNHVHSSPKAYKEFRNGADVKCFICGFEGDADINAAINIARKALV